MFSIHVYHICIHAYIHLHIQEIYIYDIVDIHNIYNDIYIYRYTYIYIICTIIHIFREIQIELGQIMKLNNQPLFLCKNMGILYIYDYIYVCARNPVE